MRSTKPNRVARLIAMGVTLGDPERPKTVIRTHSQETEAQQYQPDTTEEWMTSEQQRETARLRAVMDMLLKRLDEFERMLFIHPNATQALTRTFVEGMRKIIADAEQQENDAQKQK